MGVKMCDVGVPIPHKRCSHYVLQTCRKREKEGKCLRSSAVWRGSQEMEKEWGKWTRNEYIPSACRSYPQCSESSRIANVKCTEEEQVRSRELDGEVEEGREQKNPRECKDHAPDCVR